MFSSIKIQNQESTFTIHEIYRMFVARNDDIKTQSKPNDWAELERLSQGEFNEEKTPIARFFANFQKHCVNRKVNLCNLALSVHFASEFSQILEVNQNIAYLNLSENKLGNEGLLALLDSFENLYHLDVSGNSINEFGLLFSRLARNNCIVSLTLGSNSLHSRNRMGEEALAELLNFVKQNKVIQMLDVRGMMLRDQGLRMFA